MINRLEEINSPIATPLTIQEETLPSTTSDTSLPSTTSDTSPTQSAPLPEIMLSALDPQIRSVYTDLFIAENGILPEDAPLTKYVRDLFAKICSNPEIQLFVIASRQPLNACAMPNKIFITKEMIKLCEYEEELLGVLQHELKHIEMNHFNALEKLKHKEKLGELRMQEAVDADLLGLFDLDKKGINVNGYFSLMEKMAKIERKESSRPGFQLPDFTHGSPTDRLITLKTSLNFKDFAHYSEKMTPINPEFVNEESLKDSYGFPVRVEMIDMDNRYKARVKNLENMNFRACYYHWIELSLNVRKYEILKKDGLNKPQQKYMDYYKPFLHEMRAKLLKELSAELELDEAFINQILDYIEAEIQNEANFIYSKDKDTVFGREKKKKNLDEPEFLKKLIQTLIEKGKIDTFKHISIFFTETYLKSLLFSTMTFPPKDENLENKGEKTSSPELISQKKPSKKEIKDVEEVNKILLDLHHTIDNLKIKIYDNDKNEKLFKKVLKWFSPNCIYANFLTEKCFLMMGNQDPHKENKEITEKEDRETEEEIYRRKDESNYANHQSLILYLKDNRLYKYCSTDAINLINAINKIPKNISISDLNIILEKTLTFSQLDQSITIYHLFIHLMFVPDLKFSNTNTEEILKYISVIKEIDFKHRFNKNSAFIGTVFEYLMTIPVSSLNTDDHDEYLRQIEFWSEKSTLNGLDKQLMTVYWLNSKRINKSTAKKWKVEVINLNNTQYSKLQDLLMDKEILYPIFVEQYKDKVYINFEDSDIDLKIKIIQEFGEEISINESIRIFKSIIENRNWDLNSEEQIIFLLKISSICKDVVLRDIFINNLWNKYLKFLKKENKSISDWIKTLPTNIPIPLFVHDVVIEELSNCAKDFEACIEKISSFREKRKEISILVLFEAGFNFWSKNSKYELLLAMLEKDGKELKEKIVDAWQEQYIEGLENEDDGTVKDSDILKSIEKSTPINEVYLKMYLIDDSIRQTILHDLLVGVNGVLFNKKLVDKLIDYFFENFVDKGSDETDQKFVEEARKILKIAIRNSRPEDLYFLFSKLMLPRLLRLETNEVDWTEVKELKAYEEQLYHVFGYNEREELSKENPRQQSKSKESKKSTKRFSVPRILQKSLYGDETTVSIESLKSGSLGELFTETNLKTNEKLDALGLLIEIAKSLGAIGIRFLQLIGLYMDVPEKYAEAFKSVYSDIQGQSKLTAYDTYKHNLGKDEAESDLSELRIGERIGGGSIFCSYPFSDKSRKGVIKIVNPNIEGRLTSTFEVLEKTFIELAEENEKYRPLLFILSDIKKWVMRDLDIAEGVENDRQFREDNSGVESQGMISSVPKMIASNHKFVIEEFVEGRTLQYEDSPEKKKTAIQHITSMIYMQILRGLVHSDVHPGNFIVSENILHWLDRTYLLELEEREKKLIIDIVLEESNEGKLKTFVAGLLAFVENSKIDSLIIEEIMLYAKSLEGTLEFEDLLKKIFIFIREKGVKITLNITMILKNLLALKKMEIDF